MKKYLCLLSVILFLCSGLFAAQEEWITLSNSNSYAVGVNVVSSNENLIEIEYQLNGFYKKPIEINGEKYSKIILPNESIFLQEGFPELPRVNRSIIIPAKAKMIANVVYYEIEEFRNINIIPSKGNLLRSVNPEDIPYTFSDFYTTDSWFPKDIVSTYDPYILRDARGMVVELHPFQYNPAQKVLRVYKSIRIEVENVGLDDVNTLDVDLANKRKVVKEFLTMYERRFINFKNARYDLVPEIGNMLIITADEYYDAILPFSGWKNQKGIPTIIKTITEIGGNTQTNIMTEIQYQYDNNNMAFVVLVGDADDVVPHSIKKDPLYVLLAGYDHYPDALISRFCANIPSHIENQVNRSVRYERDVEDLGGDWYHKGTGIASAAGPGDDGEYDWQHLRNIRAQLLAYNYTHVDELYDGSQGGDDAPGNPTAAMVVTALSDGRSLVNYTGHGGMTSWSTSGFSNYNVDQLTNGFMMPLVISVACNTGEFQSGECLGEHFLKAGTTDTPKGAIGFYGSTISQSWNPPMEAQDEATYMIVDETALTLGGICFNGACSMMDDYGYAGQSEYDAWTLFGDASLQIKTTNAEAMTVIHNPIIPLGSTTYDVEVVGVEGALIGLYMNNILYGYGYTDINGYVTIELIEDLLDPGEMTLTVTSYNKIPYITTIDAIIPVQVIIFPDTINVNESTEVYVTVLDSDGIEPEVGVNVWAVGLDFEIDPVVTDTNGVAILTINYQFGPSLNILGQRPDDSFLLFDELLYVIALDLTDPDLEVTTDFGLSDGFGMNLPGIIHAYCSEDETTLWARLNDNPFTSTNEDTLEFIPDELGTVYAIISKSGYNLYQKEFPVMIAYGTISGIVINSETSNPIPDIEVKFYEQGADPTTDDPIFTDITDVNGLYEITDEQPVDYYDIYINEWGFNPYQELDYFLGYGDNTHDIVIDPVESGIVKGRIYDDNKGVVANATLIYYRSDNGEEFAVVPTNPAGRYSVILPFFTYDIYVSAPNHVPYSGTITVLGDAIKDYNLGIAALFSNFEDDDGGFTSNPPAGGWQWGEPTAGGIPAYSGENVWATNLNGYYNNSVNWYLNSPEFTVPDNGILIFYHYYDFENPSTFYDGGNVKISTNGGTSFSLITPEGGYDGTISALGQQGFGASNNEWELVEFDINSYEGQDVILRWHFASDGSVNNYYGWYIDDVLVGDPNSSYEIPVVSVDNTRITYNFELYQNHPNPVNPDIIGTNISFSLPGNVKNAKLTIYNIKGQLVKQFKMQKAKGKMNILWDGKDESGKIVNSGIYFYRLKVGDKVVDTKKCLLIR